MFLRTLRILLLALLPVPVFVDLAAGQAGRFPVQSIGIRDGMSQSTVSDAAFDRLNFLWIAYPGGIQRFDGHRFVGIHPQAGLPDTRLCRLFRTSDSSLLIAHTHGISLYSAASGRFQQVYSNSKDCNRVPEFIGEQNGLIWTTDRLNGFVSLRQHSYNVNSRLPFHAFTTLSPTDSAITTISAIRQNQVLLVQGRTILCCDLSLQKCVSRFTPAFDFFPQPVHFLPSGEVEIYRKGKGTAYLLDLANQTATRQPNANNADLISIRSVSFAWQGKMHKTLQNRVFRQSRDGAFTELTDMNGAPLTGNDVVQKALVDKYDNLYLLTIKGGIRRVAPPRYALSYYGAAEQEDDYALAVLPDKASNRILIGAQAKGLYVQDSLNRTIRHIGKLPGAERPFALNAIVKTVDGSYLLYCIGESAVWMLDRNLGKLTPHRITGAAPHSPVIGYFHTVLQNTPDTVLSYTDRRLITYLPKAKMAYMHEFPAGTSSVAGLYRGELVVQQGDDLLFVNPAKHTVSSKMNLNGTGGVRCFTEFRGQLYIGCNAGVVVITPDHRVARRYRSIDGLPDECIYTMAFDSRARLWCSSNKGIFSIGTDEEIIHLTAEDGLQGSEFNTGVVATARDGELYFGGVNGVSSFFPEGIQAQKATTNLLVTDVLVNNVPAFPDSAAWNIDHLALPWQQNLLSIGFLAMGQKKPSSYRHLYKMEGIDKEWMVNKDLQPVRYLLPPGEYVLSLAATESYENDPVPQRQIRITIRPPFYKTWWFGGLIGLLVLSLLTIIINRYNRHKYNARLQALETESRIQSERERISRDLHDNIGAYANSILYHTELLETEAGIVVPDNMKDNLRYASKDIIASLRETVWALKKETYSAEEAFSRIRNYVQACAGHYPAIQFRLSGNVPEVKMLSHTAALNFVRIVQEAITNAVKHAKPHNIFVKTANNAAWEILVEDDGSGFDPDTITPGNGLENMQYRARESQFVVSINSTPSGTIVAITLP